jgi:fructan beta-fructosidase
MVKWFDCCSKIFQGIPPLTIKQYNNQTMKKLFVISAILLAAFSCLSQESLYKEQYRPQFHFSSEKNWINDPNGLVYHNGQYHMFYQHNPFGNIWGHMSWGHATSKDLVHWKNLPVAIPEENGIMIFSGTCVSDKNNTSGFGKNGKTPMVAIYTGHIEGVNQSQHLAYSLDDGLTWKKYDKNPILDLNKKDFRDPKVFWYAPKKYWVMALMLSAEFKMQLYSSKNLIDWKLLSEFGPAGDTTGVWECPDLTQVPVEGQPGKKKWLLQMSMNGTMQYFVGEFDGVGFTNENPADKIYRPDYGPDYYAAICYGQLPNNHKSVSIGWINNWNYANDIPTTPWKGAMSIPRTLSAKKIGNEWVLIQKPVEKIKSLRQLAYSGKNRIIEKYISLPESTQQCEIDVEIKPNAGSVTGVRIANGNDHFLEIGYDTEKKVLYIDRSKTRNQSFNKNFEKQSRYEIPYTLTGNLRLQIFFDNSIAEVFVNGGERVFTTQLFPDEFDSEIELFSDNVYATMVSGSVYKMKSAW